MSARGDATRSVAIAEQWPHWPDSALQRALAEIGVPAGILDPEGVLRWSNAQAIEVFGDQRGRAFADVVAPESRKWAKLLVARLLVGRHRSLEARVILLDRHGRKLPGKLHGVPLRDGATLVGVFGLLHIDEETGIEGGTEKPLTPRQLEVLSALARGSTTQRIAESLEISIVTVRNHVRAILRALGVHSRLEAVIEARRRGLV